MSKEYIIEATGKTPYVNFNLPKGTLEINGYSLPQNALEFYGELSLLVDEYMKNPQVKTSIVLEMEYFNTSSSKVLLQLISKFEILTSVGKDVELLWVYDGEDVDMHEAGLTYQNSINIPIQLIPKDLE